MGEKSLTILQIKSKMNKSYSGANMLTILLLITVGCSVSNQTEKKKAVENGLIKTSADDLIPTLGNNVMVLFQDRNDHYWFANGDEGVYRFDGNRLEPFSKKDGLCSDTILGIQEDKSGNIYFETAVGVSKYDGQKFETLEIIDSNASGNKWELTPDDLWFRMGTNHKGPYRYDGSSLYQLEFPKSDQEDEFYTRYPNASFSPYGLYTIYRAMDGSVLFGTTSVGICIYDGKSFKWLYEKQLTETPAGGDFGIRSIIEDQEGYFWFCNMRYRYKFLPRNFEKNQLKYRKENGVVVSQKEDQNESPYFMSMTNDNIGDIWGVTYNGGVWRNTGKELIHYPVKEGGRDILLFSIYKDNQGVLWLGTHNDGVYKYIDGEFKRFIPLK